MGEYRGRLTVPGVVDWPLAVKIELEEERMVIAAAGFPIGEWSLDDVEVRSQEQGFEICADGETLRVSTDDDVAFADALGLRWTAPVSGSGRIGRLGSAGAGVRSATTSTAETASDLRRRLTGTGHAAERLTKFTVGRGRHERRRGRHRDNP